MKGDRKTVQSEGSRMLPGAAEQEALNGLGYSVAWCQRAGQPRSAVDVPEVPLVVSRGRREAIVAPLKKTDLAVLVPTLTQLPSHSLSTFTLEVPFPHGYYSRREVAHGSAQTVATMKVDQVGEAYEILVDAEEAERRDSF